MKFIRMTKMVSPISRLHHRIPETSDGIKGAVTLRKMEYTLTVFCATLAACQLARLGFTGFGCYLWRHISVWRMREKISNDIPQHYRIC